MEQNMGNPIRLTVLVVALSLAVGATAGCSDDPNNEDTGTADAGDATGSDADTGVDTGTDSGTDTSETVDTGPPGDDVSVQRFGVFPPQATQCASPSKSQRVPFYFTTRADGSIRPIRRGDLIRGEVVKPNRTVSAGSLTTRRLRVAETSREECKSSSDCEGPLKCGESGMRGAGRRCTRESAIEFIPGTAQQDYRPNFDPDSGQLVTILLENTGMWEGYLPNLVAAKYGEDGEIDSNPEPGRATDPELKHREAVRLFSRSLGTAVSDENTKVSMWFFGGEKPVRTRPLFMAGNRQKDYFTDSLEFPEAALEQVPDPAPLPSNVYQAILRVVDKDLGLDKYGDHEKFLVLVTDGPNEVFDNEARREKILSTLNDHDIHLFVLHLDAQIDPSLLRDDPRYWQGPESCRDDDSCDGQLPCGSDEDCAGYETCRKAKLYPDSRDGSVQETGQKYCMPDYSNGHLGPISDYADLACATDGNYLYTTEPEQLAYYARRIPYLFDGQWSIEAEFSALSDQVGLEDGFYRMSGAFMGLLSANLVQIFSLPTGMDGKINQLQDIRPVLRKGVVPGRD